MEHSKACSPYRSVPAHRSGSRAKSSPPSFGRAEIFQGARGPSALSQSAVLGSAVWFLCNRPLRLPLGLLLRAGKVFPADAGQDSAAAAVTRSLVRRINATFLTNRKHPSHKSRAGLRAARPWEGVSARAFGRLLPSGCRREVVTPDTGTAHGIRS